MKCEHVSELLVEFEDTTLPADVAEHLYQCSACRQQSRQMKTVARLMSLKKYERPDPGFEERSALAIRRRIEDMNRQSESRLGSFWKFLTDYPQLSFRYALAATVAALLVINFISMPELTPIRPAESVARLTTLYVSAPAVIPSAEPQNPSNHEPTSIEYSPWEIEYGSLKSVPVNLYFEYITENNNIPRFLQKPVGLRESRSSMWK